MGYAYQATVSVPAPTGGPHTDFTFLIKGSDALLKLASLGTGGAIQNSTTRAYSGYNQSVPADLVLSSDSAITSLFSWGLDNWDSVNGVIWIWVKIPSYSVGFTIYVSIGNATVTTYQGGSIGSEFDTATASVFHLPDGTILSAVDFKGANNGTITGATAGVGKIDGGANYASASTDKIIVPGIATSANYTFSMWVKPTLGVGTQIFVGGASGGTAVDMLSSGAVLFGQEFVIGYTPSTTFLSNGVLQYVAITISSTGAYNYYINGAPAGSFTGGPTSGIGTATGIGYSPVHAQGMLGILDEVKFASITRSADWIATEYANQSSPTLIGNFASIVSGIANSITLVGCQ